jgi:hypothetical protein
VAEEPQHKRWARAGIRLVRTQRGWIYVHLAQTGSGWLNEFDSQGKLVKTEQVYWDEERHPSFLDVDLPSGLASLGLERDEAQGLSADLLSGVKPLASPPSSRLEAVKFYAAFFPLMLGGWVLALALLIWVVLTQVL